MNFELYNEIKVIESLKRRSQHLGKRFIIDGNSPLHVVQWNIL